MENILKTKVNEEIISVLVNEDISENVAKEHVRLIQDQGIDLEAIRGCTAVYSSVHDAIYVYKKDTMVRKIDEWTGELNHAVSPTFILLSLIYDSGYSLEDLGIKPLQ